MAFVESFRVLNRAWEFESRISEDMDEVWVAKGADGEIGGNSRVFSPRKGDDDVLLCISFCCFNNEVTCFAHYLLFMILVRIYECRNVAREGVGAVIGRILVDSLTD